MKNLLISAVDRRELDQTTLEALEYQDLLELAKRMRGQLLGFAEINMGDLLYSVAQSSLVGVPADERELLEANLRRGLRLFMSNMPGRFGQTDIPVCNDSALVSAVVGSGDAERSFEFKLTSHNGEARLRLEITPRAMGATDDVLQPT